MKCESVVYIHTPESNDNDFTNRDNARCEIIASLSTTRCVLKVHTTFLNFCTLYKKVASPFKDNKLHRSFYPRRKVFFYSGYQTALFLFFGDVRYLRLQARLRLSNDGSSHCNKTNSQRDIPLKCRLFFFLRLDKPSAPFESMRWNCGIHCVRLLL